MSKSALLKSIAHWKKNTEALHPDDASTSALACALCTQYALNQAEGRSCQKCPVAKFAKEVGCLNTPYAYAAQALSFWVSHPSCEERKERFIAAAKREYRFLKKVYEETYGDT
jgi:hypothetical protein